MKVLYDFQTFTIQQYGGISRYFYELMHHLYKSDTEYDLGVRYTRNHYLTHAEVPFDIKPVPRMKTIDDLMWGLNFKGKGRLFKLYAKLAGQIDVYGENKRLSVEKLKRQDFDIFHPTYYETYFLPYIGAKPFVLTVYDMIHEVFKEQTGAMYEEKQELVAKAAKVIAISQSTKDDIVRIYGTDPAKIEVIYLANSLHPESARDVGLKLPAKYLLFVGNRNLYKNYLPLMEAVAPLLQQDPDLYVVCAGGGKLYEGELDRLRELGVEGRVLSVPADDDSLVAAYSNALAYVCPSLYEGFGIPVLEAFACGSPVIMSNISSLPEVGGEAAAYFDPKSVESMREVISKVIHDDNQRQQMIVMGRQREKQFSWAKCTDQTTALYQSII